MLKLFLSLIPATASTHTLTLQQLCETERWLPRTLSVHYHLMRIFLLSNVNTIPTPTWFTLHPNHFRIQSSHLHVISLHPIHNKVHLSILTSLVFCLHTCYFHWSICIQHWMQFHVPTFRVKVLYPFLFTCKFMFLFECVLGWVVVGKVVSIVTQHVQFPNTSCIDSIFDKFIWFYQYYSSDRRPSDSIVVCFTRWEAINSWILISCYVVAAATISGYSLAIVCILKLEGAIVFAHSDVINTLAVAIWLITGV